MSFLQDTRQAFRLLRKAPWFTSASVSVLAVGIGATTAVFSLVDATLLRPLPFRDAHQLAMLSSRSATAQKSPVSSMDFIDWHEQNKTFTGMAAVAGLTQIPISPGTGLPETVTLQTVTGGFFDVFGVRPVAGRTFHFQDDIGKSNGASVGFLMSERLWRTRFGADPAIVGGTIQVASPPRAVTILGIVPAGFKVFGAADLWEHIAITRDIGGRSGRGLQVIGRLKPEATIEQGATDVSVIARNLEQSEPATNKGWGVTIEPLQDAVVGSDLQTTSLVLGGAVLFVLLLACANIANLILARGVGRTREMAVRSALGGTQARIARQLLVESTLLGALGGLAGLAVAWSLLRIAPMLIPPQTLPAAIALGIDWRLATFAVIVTFVTALLFGLAPAWQAARVPLVEAMNTGGRGSTDRAGRVRQILAVVEIAVALLLMTGAGLLVRMLASLNGVDAGYRADRVVTMTIRLPFRALVQARNTPGVIGRYWQNMENEVAVIPGVEIAALGSDVPLGGLTNRQTFEITGQPVADAANRPTAHYQIVTPPYFRALGIPLVRGRAFTERDTFDTAQVAMVNEEFVKQHLAGRDPIGARINARAQTFPARTITREIVGVVRQVKTRPDEPSDSALQIYVPLAQNDWTATTLVVRTAADPVRLIPQIKAAVVRADPSQAVARIRTMDAVAAEATARPRFRAQLVSAFAALSAVLAAVGIFSVLIFMVQQRAREFSVRLAIGANGSDLLRLVLRDGLRIAGIGVAIGIVASLLLVRSLEGLLFGVAPIDPVTFVTAPAALLVVAVVACLAPAVRALKANPVAALRAD